MTARQKHQNTTAVAYCRTASTHPDDHAHASQQLDQCHRLANQLGTTISQQFNDLGHSGDTSNRPALQALLDYVTQHHVTYVIVSNSTRLARSPDLARLLELQLLERGCTLIIGSPDGSSTTAIGIAASKLTGLLTSRPTHHTSNHPSELSDREAATR